MASVYESIADLLLFKELYFVGPTYNFMFLCSKRPINNFYGPAPVGEEAMAVSVWDMEALRFS